MATGGGEALPAQEPRSVNTPQDSNANASNVHSSQSSQKECTEGSSAVRGKTDPAREHFAYKKDGRTNVYTCLHCGATYRGGGINRMKQHLTGIPGQIAKCKKVPHDVRHRMLESLKEIQEKKQNEDLSEAYDDQLVDPGVQANPTGSNEMQSTPQNKGKRKANVEIGSYFAPRTTPGSQPSLRSVLSSKEAIHKAKMAIARWLYDACIPFNAVQSQYFQPAVDAIAAIGLGFKGSSYHEVRVNLLGDCKRECQLLVQNQRANWAKSGCTIMADGWSDQRQRTLINFLVYCPTGMTFVKSVDASDDVKDATTLCNLFSEVIEWVGPQNVVHVVTDNAANYVAAGRLIHEKYPTIYWSPCAAHCLNLLLKDIGSMTHIAELASKASKVTIFVYNHMVFLSWLRNRDGWKEIVRPGVTRFATTFITLKNIYDHKHDLQALVVDKHFTSHRLSRTAAGKVVSSIILDNKFWNDCLIVSKIVAPIIRLLRIVDADEKPSMGYVYDGMQRAKNAIKMMFRKKKNLYKPYTELIKARWDRHLKKNLHAAAYFFNPAFFYDEDYSEKNRVVAALLDLLDKKAFCNDLAKGLKEMQVYRDRQGTFSRESAFKVAKQIRPDEWWRLYGGSAPILQKIAIRILSQTSSSSGCERNWSVFERIHTKKRNKLEHQRLSDLVYVTYNLRLKNRLDYKKRAYDPVDYESIEKVDFWIVEEETPPELDIDDIELENVIYQDNAVPITGAGDEETELTEPILDSNVVQFGSDDTGGSGSSAYDNILSFDAVNLDECYDI